MKTTHLNAAIAAHVGARRAPKPRPRGVAMIELALVLPILVLLVLGVIDFSRMIQFNNVLISLTREGANLAARSTEPPQFIVKTLMDTAEPLQMNTDGMMYITKLVGNGTQQARVAAQYRSTSGGKTSLGSALWTCSSWSSGVCNVPGSAGPPDTRPTVTLPVALTNGETVYAVEAFYDYTLFTRYVLSSDPLLSSVTIL
jgi:Flp pilus assembly protein TadG